MSESTLGDARRGLRWVRVLLAVTALAYPAALLAGQFAGHFFVERVPGFWVLRTSKITAFYTAPHRLAYATRSEQAYWFSLVCLAIFLVAVWFAVGKLGLGQWRSHWLQRLFWFGFTIALLGYAARIGGLALAINDLQHGHGSGVRTANMLVNAGNPTIYTGFALVILAVDFSLIKSGMKTLGWLGIITAVLFGVATALPYLHLLSVYTAGWVLVTGLWLAFRLRFSLIKSGMRASAGRRSQQPRSVG
jgi:hypothetical protein